MARIPMTSGFTLIPEGTYVFRVYDASYDEDFGKLEIRLVNAKGETITERYQLKTNDDTPNEGACNAFSFFAKNVMNDFDMEDVDPAELINHYVEADVEHNETESKKKPGQMLTFAHLTNYQPADAFDTEACEKALKLNRNNAKNFAGVSASKPASKSAEKQEAASEEKTGLDLDALLG